MKVSGFGCQVSVLPLATGMASLIKKESLKKANV